MSWQRFVFSLAALAACCAVPVAGSTILHLCPTACSHVASTDGLCAAQATYRACGVANSSSVFATMKRALAPARISTACADAVAAMACRMSYEVCEYSTVTVPLCVNDALDLVAAQCGGAAAAALAQAPDVARQVEEQAAHPSDTCSPVYFTEYNSYVWLAGVFVMVCADLLASIGVQLMQTGSWQAGAQGGSTWCNASWLSGGVLALLGTTGHAFSLGMAPLTALAPALPLVLFTYLGSGSTAPRTALRWRLPMVVLLLLCLLLVTPVVNPRYTAYGVQWLLSSSAAAGTAVVVGAALAACGALRAWAGWSTPSSLQVTHKPCLSRDSAALLAPAAAAGLLSGVGAVACKSLVEVTLGMWLGYRGAPWSTPLPYVLGGGWLAASLGQASILSPALARFPPHQVLSAYFAVLSTSTGLMGGLMWVELDSVSTLRGVGYVTLLLLQAAVLLTVALPELACGGLVSAPAPTVGAGVPHRVALPQSAVLPPLPHASPDAEAGGVQPGAIVPPSPREGGGATPSTARQLLGWFNQVGQSEQHVQYAAVGTQEEGGEVVEEDFLLELEEFGEEDWGEEGGEDDVFGSDEG